MSTFTIIVGFSKSDLMSIFNGYERLMLLANLSGSFDSLDVSIGERLAYTHCKYFSLEKFLLTASATVGMGS